MTIGIGIIGAGIMGADHAHIFSKDLPEATLVTVCDADETRAKDVAQSCGCSNFSTDPLEVINNASVDAVVIASPDPSHAGYIQAALKVGKPVLCEKPLATTASECLEVIEAEEQAERVMIQLGFMRRFDKSYVEMKTALDTGTLGRALMMHNFHRNVETPAADFTGAMAISNSAPHEFDVARYILEAEIVAITAFQPERSDNRVAPVVMVLETTQGQLVNIEVNNNAAYAYDVRSELVGESGSIELADPVFSRTNSNLQASTKYAADWRPRFAESYRKQNRDFLKFVKSGTPSSIASNAWDGYCSALIAEAGVTSLSEGRRITIDPVNVPNLYRYKS